MNDRKIILKVLGIPGAEVARRAGVTRQAIAQSTLETGPAALVAQGLIDRATPDQRDKARRTYEALGRFLNGV